MSHFGKIAGFTRDDKGGVAIIMGLAVIPLVLASGLAADYAIVQAAKSRLDASADAAALAAIKTAQTTIAELSATNPNPRPQAIAAAMSQAEKSFYAQAGKRAADLLGKPAIDVQIKGQEVTANVAYSAAMPSNFGRIAGVKLMNYNGGAGAQLTMAKFLDFYLLLDVSGSMGLPSTPAGEAALAAKNPDDLAQYPTGCRFACHFAGSQGYNVSRANNIQLRIDAVGAAVAQLMEKAKDTATLPKQYRVGVYPFVTHANAFVDLTDNLRGDQYSVESAINYDPATRTTDFGRLLDAGKDWVFARDLNPNYKANPNIPADVTPMGAGGSHIHNIFQDINAKIPSVGDGSGASSPQPFVFFVSDGMQNSQSFVSATGTWPGVTPYPTPPGQTVSIRAMDPTLCNVLKARGITVSVLEIPYPTFTNPKPFAAAQEFKANDAVPNLSGAMRACASPNFYFMADTPEGIADAMKKMFEQAVQSARLTQ
ncbi:pilus assembly protein TadG-related protein [Methylocystis sp. ATCC 49242]|uniref:pilus assembly protein TadG-related protein n=1 Tax=Methylocystis sp. ATCC 49242 TaxID=622637 RepID=UPI0001F87862|nr:pilus assembly protein TadG-related protein [Methylocystis sp. ATCC 49242]